METWKKNVIKERKALKEKITRLISFMSSTDYHNVDRDQQMAMDEQLEAMKDYREALGRRIADFMCA